MVFLLGFLGALLVVDDLPERSQGQLPVSSLAEAPAPVRAEGPQQRVDLPVSIGPLVVVDSLTGQTLKCPISLLAAESNVRLVPGDRVDLSGFPEDAVLGYSLPDGQRYRQGTLGQSREWTGGSWVLTIPFFALIEVRVYDVPDDMLDRDSIVQVFPDPRSAKAEASDVDAGNTPTPLSDFVQKMQELHNLNPFEGDGMDTTLNGLMRRAIRSKKLSHLGTSKYTQQSDNSIAIAGIGPHVIGWFDRSGASCFAEVTLLPGERTSVALQYSHRPLLHGQLIDWEGNPVPNAVLSMTSALDLHDYDLSPADTHAMIVLVKAGTSYHSVRRDVRTDADGNFALRVPSGAGYSIESHARGGYVFWNSRDNPKQPSLDIEVLLELLEPVEEHLLTVSFRDPSGSPIIEGAVSFAVPSDVPFFRQWAEKIPLDQYGQVKVLGFDPGSKVGIILYHDSLKGGMFPDPYLTVPSFREITVIVPTDAYLEHEETP
ncbi:MAG: hypothetical protein H8E31_08350 [Planctomycetes bacterium]|nr:hypothetical protein [Planctomycetota bacterium]